MRKSSSCAVGRRHGTLASARPQRSLRRQLRDRRADRWPVPPPSAQYSASPSASRSPTGPGMLGQVAERDRRGRRHDRRDRPRRGRRATTAARHHRRRRRPGALGRDRRARSTRSTARAWSTPPTARFLLHVGGKIEQRNKHAAARRATTSRWPTRRASRASAWRSPRTRDKAFQYTIKRNTVAVVSDGTAVLGLGDIGPEAAMPVMEGKAMLFKEFAGVDAFPICLDTKDPDEIVETVQRDRARLRRHQPRGHLRAALLRDRGPAEGSSSTSRSSTTTSTAPRSSCSRRCSTRCKLTGRELDGPARARHRPRRGRRRGDQDPHGGRRARHRRRRLARALVAPSATTTSTAR